MGGRAPLHEVSDSDRGQPLADSAPRSKHGVSSDLANQQALETVKQKCSMRQSGCRIGTISQARQPSDPITATTGEQVSRLRT